MAKGTPIDIAAQGHDPAEGTECLWPVLDEARWFPRKDGYRVRRCPVRPFFEIPEGNSSPSKGVWERLTKQGETSEMSTIVIIIVLVILFGGGGGYWFSRRR
jgi:hypothetical protein